MTTHPEHPHADPAPLPPSLAERMRTLRGDVPPGRDLWPDIAARLESRPPCAAPPRRGPGRRAGRRAGRRRNVAYATAAVLALAIAAGSQWLPPGPSGGPSPQSGPAPGGMVAGTGAAEAPLLLVADALSREYQAALREVEATAALRPGVRAGAPGQVALAAELERSATEVRAALARDPDAVHLLHRLRHIYAHRLALSLRQAPPQESTA